MIHQLRMSLLVILLEFRMMIHQLRMYQLLVKNTNLINKLVKTGKFTEAEAKQFVSKSMQNGPDVTSTSQYYSHLILSHLILSHLILSHLILSHLILSHLILSHLIIKPIIMISRPVLTQIILKSMTISMTLLMI